MCNCEQEKNVHLPTLNIYTLMAEYKKDENAKGIQIIGKHLVDFNNELTQEQLAFAYEELGITDGITKVDKTIKSDEESSAKKSTKKGKSSKKAAEEK